MGVLRDAVAAEERRAEEREARAKIAIMESTRPLPDLTDRAAWGFHTIGEMMRAVWRGDSEAAKYWGAEFDRLSSK